MLADFYGARMVGQKESKMDELIDQVPGVVHLTPVDTIPQMFEALHAGAADGVIITLESTSSFLKEFPGLTVVRFVYGQGFKLDYNGICVAVRKGDEKLLHAVNEALSGISTETRLELIKKMTEKSEKAG
jgi:ABC-type amino acid transport substrate-binding protein